MIKSLSKLLSVYIPDTANVIPLTNSSDAQEMYNTFWQEITGQVSPSNTIKRNNALTREIKDVVHSFASNHGLECTCERYRIDHNLYDKNNELIFSIEHENQGLEEILLEEILKLRDVNSKCNVVFYYQRNTDLNNLDWSQFLDIQSQMIRIQSNYFRNSKPGDKSLLVITGIPDTVLHKIVYTGYVLRADSISDPFTRFCGYRITNEKFTSSNFKTAIQQAAIAKVANTLGSI